MLLSKSEYSNVKLNIRLYAWLSVLGFVITLAGYSAWEARQLPTVATKTIAMHQAARLPLLAVQRLPWAPEWHHVRGYVQGASPTYSQALDAVFDRAMQAAVGGAVGVPVLIFFLASFARQKKPKRS